jgi:hypothetical protein
MDQPPWDISTSATPQTIITVVLGVVVAGFVVAATFMASWVVGMPYFLVLVNDSSHMARMAAALVSMVLGLVAIDVLIRLGTGQLRLLPAEPARDKVDVFGFYLPFVTFLDLVLRHDLNRAALAAPARRRIRFAAHQTRGVSP